MIWYPRDGSGFWLTHEFAWLSMVFFFRLEMQTFSLDIPSASYSQGKKDIGDTGFWKNVIKIW